MNLLQVLKEFGCFYWLSILGHNVPKIIDTSPLEQEEGVSDAISFEMQISLHLSPLAQLKPKGLIQALLTLAYLWEGFKREKDNTSAST